MVIVSVQHSQWYCSYRIQINFIIYHSFLFFSFQVRIKTDEFEKEDAKKVIQFVAHTKRNKPHTKSRYSNQTWLETDKSSAKTLQVLRHRYQFDIFHIIQSRVSRVPRVRVL
jgi:hypothetical protein